jgi:hypothetical protein
MIFLKDLGFQTIQSEQWNGSLEANSRIKARLGNLDLDMPGMTELKFSAL